MSKEINLAGKTLIVDNIVELNGSRQASRGGQIIKAVRDVTSTEQKMFNLVADSSSVTVIPDSKNDQVINFSAVIKGYDSPVISMTSDKVPLICNYTVSALTSTAIKQLYPEGTLVAANLSGWHRGNRFVVGSQASVVFECMDGYVSLIITVTQVLSDYVKGTVNIGGVWDCRYGLDDHNPLTMKAYVPYTLGEDLIFYLYNNNVQKDKLFFTCTSAAIARTENEFANNDSPDTPPSESAVWGTRDTIEPSLSAPYIWQRITYYYSDGSSKVNTPFVCEIFENTPTPRYLGTYAQAPEPEEGEEFIIGDYYLSSRDGNIYKYQEDESGEYLFALVENPSASMLSSCLTDAINLGDLEGGAIEWIRTLAADTAFINSLHVTDANIDNVDIKRVIIPNKSDGKPAWQWDANGIRAIGEDDKEWWFRTDGSVYLNSAEIVGELTATDIDSPNILKTQHAMPFDEQITETFTPSFWSSDKLANQLLTVNTTNAPTQAPQTITYDGESYDRFFVKYNTSNRFDSNADYSTYFGSKGTHTIFSGTVADLALGRNIGADSGYSPTITNITPKTIQDTTTPVFVKIQHTETNCSLSISVNGNEVAGSKQVFEYSSYLIPTDTISISGYNSSSSGKYDCTFNAKVWLKDDGSQSKMSGEMIFGYKQEPSLSSTTTRTSIGVATEPPWERAYSFVAPTGANRVRFQWKGTGSPVGDVVYYGSEDSTYIRPVGESSLGTKLFSGREYSVTPGVEYELLMQSYMTKDNGGGASVVYVFYTKKTTITDFAALFYMNNPAISKSGSYVSLINNSKITNIPVFPETNLSCWYTTGINVPFISLSAERIPQSEVYNSLVNNGIRRNFDYLTIPTYSNVFVVNGGTYHPTKIRLTNTAFIITDNGIDYAFESTAVSGTDSLLSSCSYSVLIYGQSDAVLTNNLEPFDNIDAIIGTVEKPYAAGYIEELFGNLTGNVSGDVVGNVNSAGTTNLVYGAVFN